VTGTGRSDPRGAARIPVLFILAQSQQAGRWVSPAARPAPAWANAGPWDFDLIRWACRHCLCPGSCRCDNQPLSRENGAIGAKNLPGARCPSSCGPPADFRPTHWTLAASPEDQEAALGDAGSSWCGPKGTPKALNFRQRKNEKRIASNRRNSQPHDTGTFEERPGKLKAKDLEPVWLLNDATEPGRRAFRVRLYPTIRAKPSIGSQNAQNRMRSATECRSPDQPPEVLLDPD